MAHRHFPTEEFLEALSAHDLKPLDICKAYGNISSATLYRILKSEQPNPYLRSLMESILSDMKTGRFNGLEGYEYQPAQYKRTLKGYKYQPARWIKKNKFNIWNKIKALFKPAS